MATVTGKRYGGRKSATDYANQALRLGWTAYNSSNPDRKAQADNLRRTAMKRSDDIISGGRYQRDMGAASYNYEHGNTERGNMIMRRADYRKYSTTKQAVYARSRRAMGQNGG